MKKFFAIFALAGVLVACGNDAANTDTTDTTTTVDPVVTDTTGMGISTDTTGLGTGTMGADTTSAAGTTDSAAQ